MLEKVTSDMEIELEGKNLITHRSIMQSEISVQNITILKKLRELKKMEELGKFKYKQKSEIVNETLGYELIVKKSGIKGAGEGVFLEGRVEAGKVIGFFPGIVWLPEVR